MTWVFEHENKITKYENWDDIFQFYNTSFAYATKISDDNNEYPEWIPNKAEAWIKNTINKLTEKFDKSDRPFSEVDQIKMLNSLVRGIPIASYMYDMAAQSNPYIAELLRAIGSLYIFQDDPIKHFPMVNKALDHCLQSLYNYKVDKGSDDPDTAREEFLEEIKESFKTRLGKPKEKTRA